MANIINSFILIKTLIINMSEVNDPPAENAEGAPAEKPVEAAMEEPEMMAQGEDM